MEVDESKELLSVSTPTPSTFKHFEKISRYITVIMTGIPRQSTDNWLFRLFIIVIVVVMVVVMVMSFLNRPNIPR